MGDINAKIGSDNTERGQWICKGCGTINNNGERLVNFCLNNNCAICGTCVQHKDVHKLIWKSSYREIVNQIDLVAIHNKWRRSLKNVHTCKGTDAGNDHYLMLSRFNLCLRKAPAKKNRTRKLRFTRRNLRW